MERSLAQSLFTYNIICLYSVILHFDQKNIVYFCYTFCLYIFALFVSYFCYIFRDKLLYIIVRKKKYIYLQKRRFATLARFIVIKNAISFFLLYWYFRDTLSIFTKKNIMLQSFY